MPMATFDALAYSETLQEGGIPMEQANAFARAQKKAMDEAFRINDLATKKDLQIAINELELRQAQDNLKNWYKTSLPLVLNVLLLQTVIVFSAIGIGGALIFWRFSG